MNTAEPETIRRGLGAAQEFHKNNTGKLFDYFTLEDGESKIIRVLAANNPSETRIEIQSLFMHRAYQIIKDTRCKWGGEDYNGAVCPLCAEKCPRTMRTFIPVRVRGDEDVTRVKVWIVGRELVDLLASVIEEMPDQDITMQDLKVKRTGQKLNTKYTVFPVDGTKRPLDKDELALEIPDMDALMPIKSDDELATIAMTYARSKNVKPIGNEATEEKPPF